MKYQVTLKAPRDMREENYRHGGNTLCEERNGYRYGIWFDSLEEAQAACIKHNAYCIIDDDMIEPVWYNPNYESDSFEQLKKQLTDILMPKY